MMINLLFCQFLCRLCLIQAAGLRYKVICRKIPASVTNKGTTNSAHQFIPDGIAVFGEV